MFPLACAALAVAACDSDSYYPGYGGGFFGGGGTGFDSGVGSREIVPSPCDTARIGESCHSTSIVCERGIRANVRCNPVVACDYDDTSAYVWREDAGVSCPDQCPDTVTREGPDGGCSGATASTFMCAYPEGTCGCAQVRPGEGDAGADAEAGIAIDAGVDDDGGRTYVWTCVTPDAGCPRERPRLGTRCVVSMTCDYGVGVFDDGITVECSGGPEGIWISPQE